MTTPTKRRNITGDERENLATELAEKYQQGASLRALAEKCGRSYGFVHRLLSDAGAQLRARGGNTKGRRP